MKYRLVAIIGLACLAPVGLQAQSDESTLIDRYNEAVNLLNGGKYAAARAALERLEAVAGNVGKSAPAYGRAQELLKAAPGLRDASFRNSSIRAQEQARKAIDEARVADAVDHWTQALGDQTSLKKLHPDDGSLEESAKALEQPLIQARVLTALFRGQALAEETLRAGAPEEPRLISASLPDFSLPRWDKPGLVRLSDFADQAVVIVFWQADDSSAPLTWAALAALRKHPAGRGLAVLPISFDRGEGLAKLATFVKEHPPDGPIALDDRADCAQQLLQNNFSLPGIVLVTRKRRALWVSGRDPLGAWVALVRAVERERTATPGENLPGPVPEYPRAEPFFSVAASDPAVASIRFAGKPTIMLVTDPGDRNPHVTDLAAQVVKYGSRLQAVAVVGGDEFAAARAFARGKPFPVLHARLGLPECYGPNYASKLVFITAGGRVLKVVPLSGEPAHERAVLERCAEALASPGGIPADAEARARSNLAARAAGGAIERVSSSAEPRSARWLIDGAGGNPLWTSAPGLPQELVVSFLGRASATFDRLRLDRRSALAVFEVLAGNERDGEFRSLGRFRMEDRDGMQSFVLPRTDASFVKLRFVSSFSEKAPVSLGEVAIEEAAGVRPPLDERVVVGLRAGSGFHDDFAQDDLRFWEQRDYLSLGARAVWRVEQGRLIVPEAPRGLDRRSSGLLHAYPPVTDFRLEAVVEGDHDALGLVFGFQDWDNYDQLLMLKGSVRTGRPEGNSIRLERWRGGRLEVLGVHGEPYPTNQPIALAIIRQGSRLAVKANGHAIFSRADPDPRSGRFGFSACGDGRSTVDDVRMTPLTASDQIEWPEINPLTTAAGASIVWLNSQGSAQDPQCWASNLLRVPVFTPVGAWEASPGEGAAPEVVFAFHEGREVALSGVGFALPQRKGAAANDLVRTVEVLATRDALPRPERFRPLGTFTLQARTGLQEFTLPAPAVCRYLMIRVRENREGARSCIERVTVTLAGTNAIPESDGARDRVVVEQAFASPPDEREHEPNDGMDQANALTDSRSMEGVIRAGETDIFLLPDPPSARGSRSVRIRLDALPWLRLNADVTDVAGSAIAPPLARSEAGQSLEQVRYVPSPGVVPRAVRVAMPALSLGVVLDTSGSMGGREGDVRAAVNAFLGGSPPGESVEVLQFGSTVERIGWLPADRQEVRAAIDRLGMSGNTALYEALLAAMKDNKAVLLLSDGMNTEFRAGFTDLCRELRLRPVPLYVIGVGWDLYEYDANSGNTAIDLLRNLARQTGGRFFFALGSAELGSLYREIAREVRGDTRYRLWAHWETADRAVALSAPATSRDGVSSHPDPLLPASVELAGNPPELGSPSILRGVLPSPLELSDAGLPGPVRMVAVGIPSGGTPELAEPNDLPMAPKRTWSVLPPVTELAAIDPGRSVSSPLWSAPLPEFGSVSVAYQAAGPGAVSLPPALRPAFELILDSSFSMSEPVDENQPKFRVARAVVDNLVDALADGVQVGLRLYGHWGVWILRRTNPNAGPIRNTDPRLDRDSQLVVPIGPLTAQKRGDLKYWTGWSQPRGKTPLVYSLLEARNDFPSDAAGPKTVILVSDGEETCGGKLGDVAAAYRGSGVSVVIHVVGFDIRDSAADRQLREIARIGGGDYYQANNARQITDALQHAVVSHAFEVSAERGEAPAVRGLINGDPLDLSPGRHRVGLPGTKAEPILVRVDGGQTVSVRLTESGKLEALGPSNP